MNLRILTLTIMALSLSACSINAPGYELPQIQPRSLDRISEGKHSSGVNLYELGRSSRMIPIELCRETLNLAQPIPDAIAN